MLVAVCLGGKESARISLTGIRLAPGYDKFSRGKARNEWSEDTAPVDDDDEETTQENVKLEKRYSALTANTINLLDERFVPFELIIRLLERVCLEDAEYAPYSSAVLVFMPGMGEIRRLNDLLAEHPVFGSEDHFKVYPLHSTISSEQQGAVFDIPPPGIRKIVIGSFMRGSACKTLIMGTRSDEHCGDRYHDP